MQLKVFPFEGKEERQQKVWELAPGNRIILEATFTRHNLVELVAIQTVEIDGRLHEVIRYDSCHGTLHRHLLFEGADVREELDWPLTKETRHRILDDLKQHWMERRTKFLQRRGMDST